ncbi:MAG: hypothetical protein CEE43_06095 [Promethearchaeota archaeon Loki_b32]|nr:MAG: hypothetical protein CEE43_06095 [Candidatus Lokiarchaeota archaeon Loki_b32]
MSILESKWEELLEAFSEGLEEAIVELKNKNVENIPGARDALLDRLDILRTQFPRNDGELLKRAIDNTIQNAFFPNTSNLAVAFSKILKSRTHEQDFIINELLNGFITSKAKAIASYAQGPIIDRIVEAFANRNDFHIVDHQFYAMFGDPNNPRSYIKKQLQELINLFGLVSKEHIVDRDKRTSEKKVYTFYTFPPGILAILQEKYIIIDKTDNEENRNEIGEDGGEIELGISINKKSEKNNLVYAHISEAFDRNVFISLFLANLAINRKDLEKIGGSFTINGISAIFALILLLSFMPKLTVRVNHPILKDPSFDNDNMSIIPKSWMMRQILESLFEPLIKIVAFRLGGGRWLNNIIDTDINKKIHNQIRFLLKDVNKWILGNLCRVEIPIFVEIANIFTEVTLGLDRDEDT